MKKTPLLIATLMLANSSAMADDVITGLGVNEFDERPHAIASLAYRFDKIWNNFRPEVGFIASHKGEHYGYGAIAYEWQFAKPWSLTPSLAVGYYGKGSGEDLGGHVQFNSTLELRYHLESNVSLGVAFSHMSNAGIYDNNPGSEAARLLFTMPIGN